MRLPYSAAEKMAGLILFVCFGLILAAMILVGVGRDWFQSYTNYFAFYHEGYGILPGVKVKFLQTDIGRVERLEITRTDNVKFYLTIQSEFAPRIKGDSLANIRSPTLIGKEYIEITPGSAQSLPVPPDGQIPAEDPKTVDDVIASLQFEERLKDFEVIMNNLASLTRQLQDPQGPILGTMDNLKRVTGQVASGEGLVGQLFTKDDAYNELLSILRELRGVSESINESAAILKKDIPNVTGKIDQILNQVETGTRSLPEVARGAREGIRDVNQVLDSVKRNFLIRGNLTPDQPPDALTLPARDR
ncbi:MAG: MlaD family protein [Deltaproteobacteria bacterium]|jgi:phospholipid/cholesterol/gamma-HCH transport system substrate-binding protein|nr:MlaD family protein [Deltaproteobacteria bacterium]